MCVSLPLPRQRQRDTHRDVLLTERCKARRRFSASRSELRHRHHKVPPKIAVALRVYCSIVVVVVALRVYSSRSHLGTYRLT